jgi:2-(1,2-epoxy-1,2-dihydrophenyl)acetyl-CoA isomerase
MSDESPSILYEVTNGVAVLTLNRPDKLNAINSEMARRWADCLAQAQEDEAVGAVLITGAGKGFCSGGDVERMGGDDAMTPLRIKERLRQGVQRIPLQLARMDKPVIAAINGVAVAAGLDLALACDIRFAAASARLGETYNRVGLVPGAGGAYFLPRIVGVGKALELLWSGELLDAEQAQGLGLVNRVFPDAELLPGARAFAERVAAAPPLSVRLIKRAVYQSLGTDLATSLDLVSSHMTLVRNSEDHAEAVAALREKRPGVFRGR